MKNDPSFKFVAAIILAGVIAALAGPSRQTAPLAHSPAEPTSSVHASE